MSSKIELEIGSGATPGEFSVRVISAPTGGEPATTMRLDVDGLLAGRDELAALVLRSAAAGDSLAEGQLRELGIRLATRCLPARSTAPTGRAWGLPECSTNECA